MHRHAHIWILILSNVGPISKQSQKITMESFKESALVFTRYQGLHAHITTRKCRFNIIRLTSVFNKIDVNINRGGIIVNNVYSFTSGF